ncbi:MAG: aldehyde dehydrogenase family protein [Streptosporangiaceae bacterium]
MQKDTPPAYTASGYIDGRWVSGEGEPFEVINPANEDVLAVVPALTTAQADQAVSAAARAFTTGPWSRVPPRERSQLLHRLADLLERDQDRLTDLMIDEIGTPRAVASFMQVPFPVRNFRWFADAAASLAAGPDQWVPATAAGEGTATLLAREPIGVVLGLTAFNFPLNLAAWKIGGALASGCSIVLMCSPKSVLTTTALAALIEEAGFPPGAFNYVYGPPDLAEHLCSHPGIDFVTFTGSAAVGRRIVELAAPTLKRVVLELGGKSADVLLPGTDVASLAMRCVLGWTGNAGQGCSSLTRTLVHRPDYDRYLTAAVASAEALGCGDPHDEKTVVGPLVSAAQRARVAGYVDRAVAAGANVLTGGKPPQGFGKGYYYEPTVVTGVGNSAEIARDELFGPVSVVLPYEDVDEAVALANDTIYGLAANVWGPTASAVGIAHRIRAGTVTVNGGGPMLGDHPWGGYKQSGLGREGGVLGFAEFFETKHILWPLDQPA